MSGTVVVRNVLDRTSAGLWSVANNCARSDLATEMRSRAEEFDRCRDAVTDLLAAANRLEARGFFQSVSCADAATLADMAAMRAALRHAQGAPR